MDCLVSPNQCYPGLAFHETLGNMGHNRSLFVKLANLFVEQHSLDLELIAQALNGGDRELALQLTHTLRGTAGNLGAITLYHCAGDLEVEINGAKTLPKVGHEFKQAMTELQSSLALMVADLSQKEPVVS